MSIVLYTESRSKGNGLHLYLYSLEPNHNDGRQVGSVPGTQYFEACYIHWRRWMSGNMLLARFSLFFILLQCSTATADPISTYLREGGCHGRNFVGLITAMRDSTTTYQLKYSLRHSSILKHAYFTLPARLEVPWKPAPTLHFIILFFLLRLGVHDGRIHYCQAILWSKFTIYHFGSHHHKGQNIRK